jgi:ATP-binding cassette subfamily A (ABC1) protein 3
VSLKTSLGEGYTIGISFPDTHSEKSQAHDSAQHILSIIASNAPQARCTQLSETTATFALRSKDSHVVGRVLETLEQEKARGSIVAYDAHGTSLEDIFIGLMGRDTQFADGRIDEDPVEKPTNTSSQDSTATPVIPEDPVPLDLSDGRQTWFYQQAWAIYRKRLLILRRSWLGPLLAMAIACCGAAVPLFFMKHRVKTCVPDFAPVYVQSLMLPWSLALNEGTAAATASGLTGADVSTDPATYYPTIAPPDALQPLSGFFTSVPVYTVADKQALLDDIQTNPKNISLGGIFIDPAGNNSLLAYEATSIVNGPTLLNLVSNVWIARSSSGGDVPVIAANYLPFPARAGDQLTPMKWVCRMRYFSRLNTDQPTCRLVSSPLLWYVLRCYWCFPTHMGQKGVFPAFFALYVTKERRSDVQAMQLSNGIANPASLWFGHLLFDGMFGVIVATVVAAVFATVSKQFSYIGLFVCTQALLSCQTN